MPPQPLSSIRRDAIAIGDPSVLHRYPAIAVRLGEVIATWARIESTLGYILAIMLKSGVHASMAMYAAILNSRIQLDALEAVARVTLSQSDFEIFGAVITLVKRAGAKRHRLAHWNWGYSPETDNAVILIDPDALISANTAASEIIQKISNGEITSELPSINTKMVFVYRERDLDEIVEEMKNLHKMLLELAGLAISPEGPGASLPRSQLLDEPQIQEVLRRIRRRKKNDP